MTTENELLKQADASVKQLDDYLCDEVLLVEEAVNLSALIKALADELRGKEWQPITDAPGQMPILVCDKKIEGTTALCIIKKDGIYYCEEDGEVCISEDGYGGVDMNEYGYIATHFMLPPQPPKED